jgi:hypothetical protein
VSNTPSKFKVKPEKVAQFKSKHRNGLAPLPMDIDGERFLFRPRLGAKALEATARVDARNDFTGIFDFVRVMLVERENGDGKPEPAGSSYQRFMDLDMDAEDLMTWFAKDIGQLFDISMGESSASSTSSADGEANSSPTSDASTSST